MKKIKCEYFRKEIFLLKCLSRAVIFHSFKPKMKKSKIQDSSRFGYYLCLSTQNRLLLSNAIFMTHRFSPTVSEKAICVDNKNPTKIDFQDFKGSSFTMIKEIIHLPPRIAPVFAVITYPSDTVYKN